MSRLEQEWGRTIKTADELDDKFEIHVLNAVLERREDYPDKAGSIRWMGVSEVDQTGPFGSLKEVKKEILAEFGITASNHGGFDNQEYSDWATSYGAIITNWYADGNNEAWNDIDEEAWEQGSKQKYEYRVTAHLVFRRTWTPEVRDIKNTNLFE